MFRIELALRDYLTYTIPVVISFLELLFDWYSKKKKKKKKKKKSFAAKRVKIKPIWQRGISRTSPPSTAYSNRNNRSLHNKYMKKRNFLIMLWHYNMNGDQFYQKIFNKIKQ